MAIETITPDKACPKCSADAFGFKTTEEIQETVQIAGQERALEAVEFGIGIDRQGFNLFVTGPQGSGRHTVIRSFIDRQVRNGKPPCDWCYVNNFRQPHRPLAFDFPHGESLIFKKELRDLVDILKISLTAVFEGDDYKARLKAVADDFKRKVDKIYHRIEDKGKKDGIAVVKSDQGIMVAPMDKDGNILDTEAFLKQPEASRENISVRMEKYQVELQEGMQQITVLKREAENAKRKLKTDLARQVVSSLTNTLKSKYAQRKNLRQYLQDVEDDIIDNVDDFLYQDDGVKENIISLMTSHVPSFERYEVNILVGNDRPKVPVVYEDLPTYQNLHGRIENWAKMGMLTTHFTLIKPGSLHMANGGYIIIDARRLLMQPYAYEGLKRTLRSQQIRIEPLERLLGLMNTVSLEPEPVPLKVKVVLIGDAMLYYLLKYYDPEFESLFKVQVDFEHTMERTEGNVGRYAQLVAGMIEESNLLPMDGSGVARIIDHSARVAGDSGKISLYLEQFADIIKEADYLARKQERSFISAAEIQQALDAARRRAGRIRDRMFEAIEQDIRHIDTSGSEIGQVNGLSYISLGSLSFGIPSRITALTRPGKDGELIDIEKKAALGGPIHSKGVLILESFMRSRYLLRMPIGFRASLVFEQSYGGVEGDSASCAELCALLSSLAGLPIRQSVAITGSVSQKGEVQAIGGVNEKIEGFFDLCRSRGLTGEQGVIIPAGNIRHLMVKDEVVEAMRAGKFTLWAVSTVDDAVALLTGLPAGKRDSQGEYPDDTVNGMVENTLKRFVLDLRAFSRQKKSDRNNNDTLENEAGS